MGNQIQGKFVGADTWVVGLEHPIGLDLPHLPEDSVELLTSAHTSLTYQLFASARLLKVKKERTSALVPASNSSLALVNGGTRRSQHTTALSSLSKSPVPVAVLDSTSTPGDGNSPTDRVVTGSAGGFFAPAGTADPTGDADFVARQTLYHDYNKHHLITTFPTSAAIILPEEDCLQHDAVLRLSFYLAESKDQFEKDGISVKISDLLIPLEKAVELANNRDCKFWLAMNCFVPEKQKLVKEFERLKAEHGAQQAKMKRESELIVPLNTRPSIVITQQPSSPEIVNSSSDILQHYSSRSTAGLGSSAIRPTSTNAMFLQQTLGETPRGERIALPNSARNLQSQGAAHSADDLLITPRLNNSTTASHRGVGVLPGTTQALSTPRDSNFPSGVTPVRINQSGRKSNPASPPIPEEDYEERRSTGSASIVKSKSSSKPSAVKRIENFSLAKGSKDLPDVRKFPTSAGDLSTEEIVEFRNTSTSGRGPSPPIARRRSSGSSNASLKLEKTWDSKTQSFKDLIEFEEEVGLNKSNTISTTATGMKIKTSDAGAAAQQQQQEFLSEQDLDLISYLFDRSLSDAATARFSQPKICISLVKLEAKQVERAVLEASSGPSTQDNYSDAVSTSSSSRPDQNKIRITREINRCLLHSKMKIFQLHTQLVQDLWRVLAKQTASRSSSYAKSATSIADSATSDAIPVELLEKQIEDKFELKRKKQAFRFLSEKNTSVRKKIVFSSWRNYCLLDPVSKHRRLLIDKNAKSKLRMFLTDLQRCCFYGWFELVKQKQVLEQKRKEAKEKAEMELELARQRKSKQIEDEQEKQQILLFREKSERKQLQMLQVFEKNDKTRLLILGWKNWILFHQEVLTEKQIELARQQEQVLLEKKIKSERTKVAEAVISSSRSKTKLSQELLVVLYFQSWKDLIEEKKKLLSEGKTEEYLKQIDDLKKLQTVTVTKALSTFGSKAGNKVVLATGFHAWRKCAVEEKYRKQLAKDLATANDQSAEQLKKESELRKQKLQDAVMQNYKKSLSAFHIGILHKWHHVAIQARHEKEKFLLSKQHRTKSFDTAAQMVYFFALKNETTAFHEWHKIAIKNRTDKLVEKAVSEERKKHEEHKSRLRESAALMEDNHLAIGQKLKQKLVQLSEFSYQKIVDHHNGHLVKHCFHKWHSLTKHEQNSSNFEIQLQTTKELLSQEHAAEVEQLSKQLSKLQSKHNDNVQELKLSKEKQLVNWEESNLQLHSKVQELELELQRHSQNHQTLKTEHNTEKANLAKEIESHKLSLKNLSLHKQGLENDLKAVQFTAKNTSESLKEQVKRLEQKMGMDKEKFDLQLVEEKKLFEKQMKNKQAEFDLAKKALVKEFREEKEQLEKLNHEGIKQLKEEFRNECNELEKNMEKKIESVKKKQDLEKQDALVQLKLKHEKEMQTIKSEFQAANLKLDEEIKKWRSTVELQIKEEREQLDLEKVQLAHLREELKYAQANVPEQVKAVLLILFRELITARYTKTIQDTWKTIMHATPARLMTKNLFELGCTKLINEKNPNKKLVLQQIWRAFEHKENSLEFEEFCFGLPGRKEHLKQQADMEKGKAFNSGVGPLNGTSGSGSTISASSSKQGTTTHAAAAAEPPSLRSIPALPGSPRNVSSVLGRDDGGREQHNYSTNRKILYANNNSLAIGGGSVEEKGSGLFSASSSVSVAPQLQNIKSQVVASASGNTNYPASASSVRTSQDFFNMSFREVDVFAPSPRTEMMTATNSAAVAKLNGGGSRNPLEKSESHENLLSD